MTNHEYNHFSPTLHFLKSMAQPKRRISSLQTIDNNSGSTFKVAVRVRPLLDKERKASTIQV